MDVNALLGILLGVGGVGGIGGLVAVYRTIKQGRITDEESIITRQLKEIARLEKRADDAERNEQFQRRAKDHALDQAVMFRRLLISNSIDNVPQLEEYRDDRRAIERGNSESSA